MTTGSPIYLVSACASAEEFVAAFRRYADRTGLFVPIAEPFAVGKRVWVALALTGGGVMIAGVAEVIQSSPKPSALHGRIGMTLRFLEPDAPSKDVLAELEKARLAMKPAPPSVPPRPASVPAEPRAVAPAVGGRIDAANALAESVAIGDLTGLRPDAPKAGQKFVMPSIPTVDRAKTPSAPPETKPVDAGARSPKATTLGIAPLGRSRVLDTQPASVVPPPKNPAPGAAVATPPSTSPGVAVATHGPAAAAALPAKAANGAAETAAGGEAAMIADKPLRDDPPPVRRGKSATVPPRHVTPVAPLPIVRAPAHAAVSVEDVAEKTDLAAMPSTPDAPTGVAFELASIDSGRAYVGPPPTAAGTPVDPSPATTPRSMRASEIIATVPADEDWTMTPDAAAPTVVPQTDKAMPVVVAATTQAKGPPTGDWTITHAPDGGWTEPAKLAPPQPEPPRRPTPVPAAAGLQPSGNVVEPVAAEKALQAWEDKPTSIGPKIEIDPTLMEPVDAPAAPMFDAPGAIDPRGGVPGSVPMYPPQFGYPPPPLGAAPPVSPADVPFAQVPPMPPMPPTDVPFAQVPPMPSPPPGMPYATPPISAFGSSPPRLPGLPPPGLPTLGPAMPGVMAGGMIPDASRSGAMPVHMHAPAMSEAPGMVPPPAPPMMPGASGPGFAPPMMSGYPAPLPPQLPPMTGQLPGAPPMPPRMDPTDGGTGFFKDTNQLLAYPNDSSGYVQTPERSHRRLFVIVGAALGATLIIVAIAVLAGGKKSTGAATSRPSGSGAALAAAPTTPGSADAPGSAAGSALPPPTGSATATGSADVGSGSAVAMVQPVPPVEAGSGACSVEVTTVPPGADIATDDAHVLGQSPGTFTLPCNAPVKLTIKKQRYANVVKDVTPTPDGAKLSVHLPRVSFSVKVTSTPPGATITVGGHMLGVTPTTIHLPAFESPTIVVTKDGYTPDSEKLTVKQNNLPYHVTLKRGIKKLH